LDAFSDTGFFEAAMNKKPASSLDGSETVGVPRPGLHLDPCFQYFLDLEDVGEMLSSFSKTADGGIALIQAPKLAIG
jgi:hypothetical protein